MGQQCAMCGRKTIFFRWTTDRYFDMKKYIKVKSELENNKNVYIRREGDPVCILCIDKHGLMK